MAKHWFITGVSSGFGRALAEQLLAGGARVTGTARNVEAAADLASRYGERFSPRPLDVTDRAQVVRVVDESFAAAGRIDVIVNNAGYGLFGAAEELTDTQIDDIIATNLTGSIDVVRAALPHLRRQGGGRIIQLSSYGGQVAFPGTSMYHATKWGIEGFMESVAHEVAPFGIGVTIVQPGGARTDFRSRSAAVAPLLPEYDGTPARGALAILGEDGPPAPGDPVRMARQIIACADETPAPLRLLLGSHAWRTTVAVLRGRLEALERQESVAASTDFPPA